MQRSIERMLTTHTGSLPRPAELTTLLEAKPQKQPYDAHVFADKVRRATAEIVRQQVSHGVDIVNDGKTGKVGYSTYVTDRLTGFVGNPIASPAKSAERHVRFAEAALSGRSVIVSILPVFPSRP